MRPDVDREGLVIELGAVGLNHCPGTIQIPTAGIQNQDLVTLFK